MTRDSSGSIHAAVMEIIGLDSYLKEENYNLRQTTFLKTDRNFSGVVLFRHFPSGEFMWGYRYVDGVKTGQVFPKNSIGKDNGSTYHRMTISCMIPVVKTSSVSVFYEGHWITTTQVYTTYLHYECSGGGGSWIPNGGTGGGGYVPPPEPHHSGGSGNGGIPSGYPEGGNEDLPTLLPLPPLTKIKYDSLAEDYPCVVKLIIKKLEANTLYKSIVQPFTNSYYPDLIWDHSVQSWDSTGNKPTSLGFTDTIPDPFAANSSTIRLNDKMLDSATQLMIGAAAIHESVHAYAKFYLSMKNINIEPKSSWIASAFNALKLKDSLNNNARDHIAMMRDQVFPNMMKILKGWGGNNYTDKEYKMALMYGLNNAGNLSGLYVSKETIDMVNKLFKALLKKYNINKKELNNFYHTQLFNAPDNKKMPKDCNF